MLFQMSAEGWMLLKAWGVRHNATSSSHITSSTYRHGRHRQTCRDSSRVAHETPRPSHERSAKGQLWSVKKRENPFPKVIDQSCSPGEVQSTVTRTTRGTVLTILMTVHPAMPHTEPVLSGNSTSSTGRCQWSCPYLQAGKCHLQHPALTCLKKLGLHTMSASNTTTTSCTRMAAAVAEACFAALLSFNFLPVVADASAPPAAAAWVASAKMCFRQLLRLPDLPLISPEGRTRPETYLHAADRVVFTHHAQHTDSGCGGCLCGLTCEAPTH